MQIYFPMLTPRQHEVANGIINGKTNKQIGNEIGIVEKSVKAHVTQILYVLGCTNRTEAAIILLNHFKLALTDDLKRKSVENVTGNTTGKKIKA